MMFYTIVFLLPTIGHALRLGAAFRTDTGKEWLDLIPQEIVAKNQKNFEAAAVRLASASKSDYVAPDMGEFVVKNNHGTARAPNNRFEAVQIELVLEPPLIDHEPVWKGQKESKGFGGKNIVGLDTLKKAKDCNVYAIGISGNSEFEQLIEKETGCEVHAFDCTIKENYKSVKGMAFKFHEWCIGPEDSKLGSIDDHFAGRMKGSEKVFKTLGTTMKELGHTKIDLLKFDIEGFEWSLFENELLKGLVRPQQILFELHTEGAKPWSVPTENTHGRNNQVVNTLFSQLHELDYRVASKELNPNDHACAEFVVINIPK